MQSVCCLPAVLSTGWVRRKDIFGAIGVWSFGACLHAGCGIATEHYVGMNSAAELIAATGDVVVILATVSMYFFLAARCILALGEAGNFPAAIKVTAEYFPKKDRAYATSIFNAVLLLVLWSLLSLFPCWQKLGVGRWLLS